MLEFHPADKEKAGCKLLDISDRIFDPICEKRNNVLMSCFETEDKGGFGRKDKRKKGKNKKKAEKSVEDRTSEKKKKRKDFDRVGTES